MKNQPVILVSGSFNAIAIPADKRPKYVAIDCIPLNHILPIIINVIE